MLERKVVTVLFVDLVGSTPLAGQIDPEDLRLRLARYRDTVANEVRRFDGTMEKFIGDAVMAVFGSPQAHGDDPVRALRSAFAIRDAVTALGIGLQLRVGLETGEVVADPGASTHGEFMVTGEVVHMAQRLQAAADPGTILVGPRAWRDTRSYGDFADLPPLTLKGVSGPIRAYRATGVRETPSGVLSGKDLAFVGRAHELALLDLLFTLVVTERRPQLVTIIGPAGSGKTRLVEEFLRRAATRDPAPSVRRGVCKPYGEPHLYCPIGGSSVRTFPSGPHSATLGDSRQRIVH